MFSFVSQSLRDAPGSGSVFAVFPALAALALLAVFAATPLTAPSADAAVSSDDIPASAPVSADAESDDSEDEFSSDIDIPDFYTGADGDVFALAEDVFGSPDLEEDPADAVVDDIEPFPAEREALEKAQADPSRLNIMTLAMVRARMATMLLAKAHASMDLPPSQSGMDRALAYGLSAVDLVPDEPAFTFLLAQIYAAHTKSALMLSLAEDAAERTLALDPAKAEARLLLGAILFRERYFGPAIDNFERALTDKGDLLDIRTAGLLGSAYCLDGQAARGERFLDALAKKNPKSGPALFALAVLQRAMGNDKDAQAGMKKAIPALKADPEAQKYARTLLKEWGGNGQ
jgi:tetratricopeptide (TPR) repeat protein